METSVETMDPLGVNAPMQPEGEPSTHLQITGPATNRPNLNVNPALEGVHYIYLSKRYYPEMSTSLLLDYFLNS